jgi:two-component system alkaline phosphatase synthesis response regulator PhoP
MDIANLIRVNLVELGIATEHEINGQLGLRKALDNHYSVLLLDIMLPGINGLDICPQVREKKSEQAIVMLTAKNSETDRVLGLELGADDYMTKPFSVCELQARVRSQLRKAHFLQQVTQEQGLSPEKALNIGKLRIDQQTHQVKLAEQLLDLTATEFELLFHLASHPNQVLAVVSY